MIANDAIYAPELWNQYARFHASVTSVVQYELYGEASQYLSGQVADFGCGSAKVAAFLADKKEVSSYTGVDCSEDMVNMARWLMNNLGNDRFNVCLSTIEGFQQSGFSSAISVNSYYAWPDPLQTLRHISSLLRVGATFVLATPNRALNMENILHDERKALIAHPDFASFSRQNQAFAENHRANFVDMDELVGQARCAGFRVNACHQKLYNGGLNFLVLTKTVSA